MTKTYDELLQVVRERRAVAAAVIATMAEKMTGEGGHHKLRHALEWGHLHTAVADLSAADDVLARAADAVANPCYETCRAAAKYMRYLAREWTAREVSARRVSRCTSIASNALEDFDMDARAVYVRDNRLGHDGCELEELAQAFERAAGVTP